MRKKTRCRKCYTVLISQDSHTPACQCSWTPDMRVVEIDYRKHKSTTEESLGFAKELLNDPGDELPW